MLSKPSTVHLKKLLSDITWASCLTPFIDFSHRLPIVLCFAFTRSFKKTTTTSCFSFCSLCFISFHMYSLFISPPPFLSSSHQLFRHCVSLVLPLQCPGCITVMHFQCFDHLTCHVVMSPPWVASLCKLFRNA